LAAEVARLIAGGTWPVTEAARPVPGIPLVAALRRIVTALIATALIVEAPLLISPAIRLPISRWSTAESFS
jgi:hypothetical protein